MNARRDDDEWRRDLGSRDPAVRDDAVRDLQDPLFRGLSKNLSRRGRVDDAFLDDVVQEACLKVLDGIGSFEGRSAFRTWTVTVAVRTAMSKMRAWDWRNVSLESIAAGAGFDPRTLFDASETTERTQERMRLLSRLKELVETELTDRQWTAVTAELGGMPHPQIAERLGGNANAVYKLLHDARKKLRRGLEASGYTVEDVREAWA